LEGRWEGRWEGWLAEPRRGGRKGSFKGRWEGRWKGRAEVKGLSVFQHAPDLEVNVLVEGCTGGTASPADTGVGVGWSVWGGGQGTGRRVHGGRWEYGCLVP
jgi:hypothetical protein